MANNKVILADGTIIMDISDTTASPATVTEGVVFYAADGSRSVGTYRYKMLHVTTSVSSLPKTISDSRITSLMRVVEMQLGNPGVMKSNLSWTTSDGSVVFSGTMDGTTTFDFDLIEAET